MVKLHWPLLALVAISLPIEAILAQAKITSTGRIYKPAPPSEEPRESESASAKDIESERSISPPSAEEEVATDSEVTEHALVQKQPVEVAETEVRSGDGQLHLICVGAGAANKIGSASTYGSVDGSISSYGKHVGNFDGSVNSTTTYSRSQAFEDQVAIRITPDGGRLRMPRTMLPALRGGKDGWFKLRKIKYKPHEITATIAVNFMNKPQLRLDRYTGAISISGKAGDYTGQCSRFNPNQTQKAF